jgi:hypothetical protein
MSSMQGQELANDRLDVQADEDSEHVRCHFFPDQDCSFCRQFFGAMAIWYQCVPAAEKPAGLATFWRRPEIMLIGCDSG